jgi:hypothetical protein
MNFASTAITPSGPEATKSTPVMRGFSFSNAKPTLYSNPQSTGFPIDGNSPSAPTSQGRPSFRFAAGPSTASASTWLDPAER